MANSGSLKSTLAVSLTNYLDAGAIVAGASGLTLWQNYLGLSEVHLGWLNFISANCLGAAVGAIIGGFLADKYLYARRADGDVFSQLPHAALRIPHYGYFRGCRCSCFLDIYL